MPGPCANDLSTREGTQVPRRRHVARASMRLRIEFEAAGRSSILSSLRHNSTKIPACEVDKRNPNPYDTRRLNPFLINFSRKKMQAQYHERMGQLRRATCFRGMSKQGLYRAVRRAGKTGHIKVWWLRFQRPRDSTGDPCRWPDRHGANNYAQEL